MNLKDNVDYWVNNQEDKDNRSYKQNLNYRRINNKNDRNNEIDFNEKKRNKFNTIVLLIKLEQ